MNQYIFILGRLPALSMAELQAVLGNPACTMLAPEVARLEVDLSEPETLLRRLGGTIKIGQTLASSLAPEGIADDIVRRSSEKKKVQFGLSWYAEKEERRRLAIGLEVKKYLRAAGISSRLVTSQEPTLSSVIVRKNHCLEYLVLPDGSVARTLAVQDFEDFATRDFGRPYRDTRSGTLPPKLARIMVNLARVPAGGALLDPFCGSGTILTEAILAGVHNVMGIDVSAKAVAQSQKNLVWLAKEYPQTEGVRWSVVSGDARTLNASLARNAFDAVVTEPYLGPPRRGKETRAQLEHVIGELADLYRAAFAQFRDVLSARGRVVFAMPEFVTGGVVLPVPVTSEIERLGFVRERGPLEYSRPGQHVRRQLFVWVKK